MGHKPHNELPPDFFRPPSRDDWVVKEVTWFLNGQIFIYRRTSLEANWIKQ